MIENNDANVEANDASTNQKQNASPNVSKRLDILLNLVVEAPERKKDANFKSPDKAKQCVVVVYKFLRKISDVVFPPGKFETPYNFMLDFNDVLSVVGVDVSVLPETLPIELESFGLICRYENGVLSISGTPNKGFEGDVRFIIKGSFYDVKVVNNCSFPVESSFDIPFPSKKFVLNPDPDSLWEDNPTSENAPFQKPNFAVASGETATIPSLTVLGASRRGRSHAQVGSFRDDHFLIRLGENYDDWNFVAVADGAGSARFSREGSKIACKTCIDDPKTGLATLFKTHYETLTREVASIVEDLSISSEVDVSRKLVQTNLQKLFYYSVRYAGEAIVNASKQTNAKLSDFNTTFLCAAFKRLPKTGQKPPHWVVLSYWVGDGGLAIYRPNGKDDVLALGTPDGGEFAGQTRFLTMKSELTEDAICGRLRLAVVEDFQALVLATDGITDPFFPAESNLSDFAYWQKFWNETLPKEFPGVLDSTKTSEERGQALLDGLNFKSKGNHDDRTLVLVLNDAFKGSSDPSEEKDAAEDSTEKKEADKSRGIIDNGAVDELAVDDGQANVESPLEVGEDSVNNCSPETCATEAKKTPSEITCGTMEVSEPQIENHVSETCSTEEENVLSSEACEVNKTSTSGVDEKIIDDSKESVSTDLGDSTSNSFDVASNDSEVPASSALGTDDATENKSDVQGVEPPVSLEKSSDELPSPPDEIVNSPLGSAGDETSRSSL